jgi:hypothetical protein
MRFLLLSALLTFLVVGCVGSEESLPGLQSPEGAVYAGSVLNFPDAEVALMRFRTGPESKMQVRVLKDGTWSTYSGTPSVQTSGDTMRVEATLPNLGPVAMNGTVDSDRTYHFAFELGDSSSTGQASFVGRAPSGLGNDPGVKPGRYAFRLDDGGGDEVFRLNPRTATGFNFAVSNIREEGGLTSFDATPLAGSPFRETLELIDGDASMGFPIATFKADLQGGMSLYVYLAWDLHETRCATDFGFMNVSGSGTGIVLKHTTRIGTTLVLKPQ